MEPQGRPPVWEEEALVPELVDRLEYQDAELARLRSDLEALREEREKLETDLSSSRSARCTRSRRSWSSPTRS